MILSRLWMSSHKHSSQHASYQDGRDTKGLNISINWLAIPACHLKLWELTLESDSVTSSSPVEVSPAQHWTSQSTEASWWGRWHWGECGQIREWPQTSVGSHRRWECDRSRTICIRYILQTLWWMKQNHILELSPSSLYIQMRECNDQVSSSQLIT